MKYVEMRWAIPETVNAAAPKLQYRSLESLSPGAWNSWGPWTDVPFFIDPEMKPVAVPSNFPIAKLQSCIDAGKEHTWFYTENGTVRACLCGAKQRAGFSGWENYE